MNKPDLLLLHGALGASSQFDPLLSLLDERYRLHRLDFEGHGTSPLRERPFRIEHFAENVSDYLSHHALACADIFGYSLGGYVALYLAKNQPGAVKRVVTLGTKFEWDPEIATREVRLLDPAKIREKVPQFARTLAERHAVAGWENVLRRTAEMMRSLGNQNVLRLEDFSSIEHQVRICLGDRDTTSSLEESAAVYRALPHGELEVLPGTPHPLEKVSLSRLAQTLIKFFA